MYFNMELDELDRKILRELKKDGRASLRKISENIDASPSTVSNRFKKLKENNVIEDFCPKFNQEKLGYKLTAITQIKTETGKIEDVHQKARELDFVESVYTVTGETDIIIKSHFKDRNHMNEGAKKIQNIDGVSESKTNVVLQYGEGLDLEI